GADDGGETNLRYTWSSTGPASVTFSANGSNAAKNATAIFTAAGSYTLTATITDAGGLSVTSSAQVTVNPPPPPTNQAPAVARAAPATPNPVTGNSTALTVLGADDGGEANLTYTWSVTGPAAVTLSGNGSNASKNVTATFGAAGNYTFVVTITDAAG